MYICVCVWLKNFHFLVAVDRSFLLSIFLASVCFLILLVFWTFPGPMTIFLTQFAFGTFSGHMILSSTDPAALFLSFLQPSSSIFYLLSAEVGAQKNPQASIRLALRPAVIFCPS